MYGGGGGYGQGQGFQQGPPGGYQQQQQYRPQGQTHGATAPNQYGAAPGNPYGSAPSGNPYGAAPAGNMYGAAAAGNPYGGAPQGGAPPGQYGAHGAYPPSGGYGAPAPPPGVDPQVWGWFQAVDTDRSGRISATELQSALTNNNWSHFNAETCRLMIGMFDRNRNGLIDVQEFSALWKYVQDWKQCFDGFDRDRSGTIDANELTQAFRGFGYNLSPQFSQLCVRTFDRASTRTMKLDDFIQCCVMLKTLTDKFREKDTQRNGVININYEQFLEMVLDTTVAQGK